MCIEQFNYFVSDCCQQNLKGGRRLQPSKAGSFQMKHYVLISHCEILILCIDCVLYL